MAKKFTDDINEILKSTKDVIELKKMMAEFDEKEENSLSRIFSIKNRISLIEESIAEQHEIRNSMLNAYEENLKRAQKEGKILSDATKQAFKDELKLQDELIKKEERRLKNLEKIRAVSKLFVSDLANAQFMTSLKDFDKYVKLASQNLGLSASRANILRSSFESSYTHIARIGGSTQELYEIQKAYAQETGRAVILSGQQLENIMDIAKGTGMSVNEASLLASKFQLVGVSTKAARTHIEHVLNTSERVGLNSSKIIDLMNTNFKRLQTYNFKNGVHGMSNLAMQSERFKQDMTSTLNSMDKARNLEDIINMSSNLQVLGGNFASLADPMQMLFEARNDPAAYAERLAKMTNGLVAMKKTADGFSFELASPMARDLLDNAAKALGISTEELTQQAFRQKELTEKRKQMLNLPINKEQRMLLETIAEFDSSSGNFNVTVGSEVVELSKLTEKQLRTLQIEKESLNQRAERARDFDTIYKSTVEQFKSVLLPIMRGVNTVLGWITPMFDKMAKWIDNQNPLIQGLMSFAGGAIMITSVIPMFVKALKSSAIGEIVGRFKGEGTSSGGTVSGSRSRGGGSRSRGGGGGNIRGGGGLATGAGIGLAAVGIGAGIGLASVGISKLADSLEKLSDEKAKTLESITWSMTTIAGIAAVTALGITLIGKSGGMAAGGLMKLGVGVIMIGAGIGIATAGIGLMGIGLAKLIEKGAESKDSLLNVAGGILAINLALATGIVGAGGLLALTTTMGVLALSANKISVVGTAFKNIGDTIRSSSDDFKNMKELLETMQKFDLSNSAIKEMSNIFKSPLKVTFDDATANITSNITLMIDGKKFISELKIPQRVAIATDYAKSGKSGGNTFG